MVTIPEAPGEVLRIVEKLEESGFETWAVGGVVRDALLGSKLGDWDLATRATPREVMSLFRGTVPIGVEHGTVGVLGRDRTLFEVTTFRRDIETTGRRAVVAFADRIEDDLARRDFTINAIAWHPLRKELLDPFGGASDLEARVLRTVGDAHERFAEDYLRILRALRFAAAFGLTIAPETWSALCGATDRLDVLSGERVREELVKLLEGLERPSGSLSLYAASGVLGVLYPELEPEGAGWIRGLMACDALPRSKPMLRLALILEGGIGTGSGSPEAVERTGAMLERLRFSNADARMISRLLGAPPLPEGGSEASERRRWLAGVGADLAPSLARLALARARVAEAFSGAAPEATLAALREVRATLATQPPLTLDDLAIGGDDLVALGHAPGPAFGEALQAMFDRVLEDPSLNTPERLRALAAELLGEPGSGNGERSGGMGA